MPTLPIMPLGLLFTWATPIWLVSLGVALGVAVLAVAYGVLWLVSRPAAAAAVAGVREGILLPIFYLACFLSAFALLAVFLIPQLPARDLLAAVARLPRVGPQEVTVTVPASTADFPIEFPSPVRLSELSWFQVASSQPLVVSTNVVTGLAQTLRFETPADEPIAWDKPVLSTKEQSRVSEAEYMQWKVTNVTPDDATLRVNLVTRIEYPEVSVVPGTALALVGLVAVYLGLRWLMPKVSAIALTTARESMSQPLFYVVLAIGFVSLVVFVYVPYNTFGDDVKMLKDSGLTLIMVLAILVAVWSASVSVSEEVEGRTAMTVLSKPVQRWQFILGKFLGILWPVVVLFVLLGTLFLATVSYKVVYDAREVSQVEPSWQMCFAEMIRILPGLVLAFFEAVVLAAISVAMSTRLPMVANLIVCATVYVLGHLVPMLVNSAVGKFEIVRFVGQFLATVLPVLDHFNIQAAVAAGATVPMSYLGMALLYCVLYSTIALLLALALFEDRDLA